MGGFKSKCNKSSVHSIEPQSQPNQMLGINLSGLAPPQSLPGTPIEPVGNSIQILLALSTQIRPFPTFKVALSVLPENDFTRPAAMC